MVQCYMLEINAMLKSYKLQKLFQKIKKENKYK